MCRAVAALLLVTLALCALTTAAAGPRRLSSAVYPWYVPARPPPLLTGPERRAVIPDFGLSRGFSAAQRARLLMALQAASDPSGPGRRRRR